MDVTVYYPIINFPPKSVTMYAIKEKQKIDVVIKPRIISTKKGIYWVTINPMVSCFIDLSYIINNISNNIYLINWHNYLIIKLVMRSYYKLGWNNFYKNINFDITT